MKIINHVRNIFNDQKLLKENPIFALLIFTPASIISSILVIPFIIICLPFSVFNLRIQKNATKFFLYIQHSISLGVLYVIKEIIFRDFQYYDIILLVSRHLTLHHARSYQINHIISCHIIALYMP